MIQFFLSLCVLYLYSIALLISRNCPELDDNKDTLAAVGRRQIPVLVVWGTEDGTIRRDSIDGVQKLIPHAKLVTIPGEGHSVHVTAPDQANPPILAFLE